MPAAASTMPTSAALSSKNTMKDGGSLLLRKASKKPSSPFAALYCRSEMNQETPSNTKASPSTR